MAGGQRALSPGSIVYDRYRVEQVLGEGGFGITYLVTDLRYQQIFCMKEYFPESMAVRDQYSDMVMPKPEKTKTFNQLKDQFLDEARILNLCRGNKNIVDVMHLLRFNNTAYYIMEYITGRDLKKRLEQNGGSLSWKDLQPIMAQVVSALREVHGRKIVHCDISPDNIFVLDDGSVKLIDFGAAKRAVKSDSTVVLMKRGYTPPEQMSRDGNVGPWTDVYALAATMYRSYTGQLPPNSTERISSDKTVWPSEMQIPIPSAHWEQTLKKAMSLRIEERYQSVDDFWRDLNLDQNQATGLALEGVQGYYKGKRLPVEGDLTFGRDAGSCRIRYPQNAPGVSNKQMCVWAEGGSLFIMDLGSSYGTWVGDTKLLPGLCYRLKLSDTIFFGASQLFRVVDMSERNTHIETIHV